MATTGRTRVAIAGGVIAAALIAVLLWRGDKTSAPAPTVAPAAVPAATPSSATPSSAVPAAAAPAAPAPAASLPSKEAIAGVERSMRLNAHTETYRLMAQRVLRENRVEARLDALYCMDAVCRGTLVEGTPEEYARWADLMSSDTSTRFASFQWDLQTVDGDRRMNFSIYVPEPKAAP